MTISTLISVLSVLNSGMYTEYPLCKIEYVSNPICTSKPANNSWSSDNYCAVNLSF